MKRKNIVIICEIVCLLLIALVLAHNIGSGIKNETLSTFVDVNLAQLITPLIALLIAFWATQYKNDQRKAKEHAEKIIVAVQNIVTSEDFSAFPENGNVTDVCRDTSARNRKLSNYISILETYSKELSFVDEYNYISGQFNEYKAITGEHLSDLKYLSDTESQFKRIADNIDSKCEAIILKFYK